MVDTCIPMQSKVKSIYLQAMLRILIPYFGYVNRRISRTQNNSCTSQKQPKCLQFLLTNQRLSRALTSTPSPSAPAWCLTLIFVKAAKVSLMLQFWPIKGYLEHLRALCRLKHKSSNLGHLAISQRTKTVYFSTVNPLDFLYIQLQMLLLPFFFRYLQCSFAVGRFISILVSVFLVPDKMLLVNLVSQLY